MKNLFFKINLSDDYYKAQDVVVNLQKDNEDLEKEIFHMKHDMIDMRRNFLHVFATLIAADNICSSINDHFNIIFCIHNLIHPLLCRLFFSFVLIIFFVRLFLWLLRFCFRLWFICLKKLCFVLTDDLKISTQSSF